MQITHQLLVFALLSLSAAQQRFSSNSSSTLSCAHSLTILSRPSTAAESFSPSLSTLPPNAAPKISVLPSVPGDTLLPRARNSHFRGRDVVAGGGDVKRKAKTTPTAMPSSIPADPLLPREEDANALYVRHHTRPAKSPKKTKPAKIGGGGGGASKKNGTENAVPKSMAPKSKAAKATGRLAVEARDLGIENNYRDMLYGRRATKSAKATKPAKTGCAGEAGGSKGNGTDNAVPKSKGPKSKAAKITGNTDLPTAAAVPIPTDAPTIPFPTGGATLPLIPTPKGNKGSGRLTTTSTAVPTTLARRARGRGLEMAGWV